MTQGLVLNSLSDLAQVRDRFVVDERVPDALALVPVIGRSDAEAIETLATSAQEAIEQLRGLIETDRARRDEAEAELARWRRVTERAAHVQRIAAQMRETATQAGALTESAIDPADRRSAAAVAAHTGRLATQAEAHAAALQREAEALAERDHIRRLLDEERSKEEEMRIREMLALAGDHLDHARHEEARRLLDSLSGTLSSVPDLTGTFETLQNRAEAVKIRMAESALREARRLHRREPVAALDLLEPLDLAGLPEELARHLYGLWLTACRRIGLLAAVHYRAGQGRGAVLIPAADGRWEVVSAIGLRRWERGRVFAPQALRGARPLA